jgi:hypothetical protein
MWLNVQKDPKAHEEAIDRMLSLFITNIAKKRLLGKVMM